MNRRRHMPALVIAIAALAVPATPAAARPARSAGSSPACSGAHSLPTAHNVTRVRHATLCLLNAQRARRGLHALRADTALGAAASRFARQMVSQRFFDHVSPGGSTMVRRIEHTAYARGARSWALAENLAWGADRESSPAEIVDTWMRSAPHRANILDGALRDIGLGVATGTPHGGRGATYVTDFGARRR
jgi:uncharacterized protein YkwD